MACGEVLNLYKYEAARTIKLDQSTPFGIGREGVIPFNPRRMDLARITFRYKTALFVVATCRT
jgi:hypothetical protein